MLSWDLRKRHRRLGRTGQAAPPGEVIFRSSRFSDYLSRSDTTVPAPSGIQDGDYLLVVFVIGAAGVAPIPVPPAGFLAVGGIYPIANPPDGSFDLQIYAWWKIANSEPANYTWTHAAAFTTLFMVDAFDAAVAIAPIASGAVDPTDTPTAPSISPPVGSLILYWAQSTNFIGAVAPPTAPPAWTERYDSASSILYAATGTAVGGATGGKSVVLTQAPTAAGMLAILPA